MKKNYFKNLSVVLSVSALALIFAACGSTSPAPQQSQESQTTETAAASEQEPSGEEEKLRIAFIPQLIGIPYFTAMEEGGNAAAADLGVEFIYTGATTANAAEQSRLVDSLITQQVDAISVSVLDSSSINPILKKAQDEGINVFTSDSDSPDSVREVYVAQATDEGLGSTLIDCLAAQIGEEGKIGIISGESTATNLNTWIEFMEKRVAEKYPNVEIVDVRYTVGGSAEESLKQAQDLMTKYPDIKGLVAVASTTVPGVCQAVEQADNVGKVAVIGYGSPATVKPFIEKGIMKESILWDAKKLGYLTVWAGVQLANGNGFQPQNDVPTFDAPVEYFEDSKILLLGEPLVIDAENVDSFDF